MKQKSKKFIAGMVFLIVGVIGILGAFAEQENLINLLMGSVLFIACGVVFIVLDKKASDKANDGESNYNNAADNISSVPDKPKVNDGEMNYNLFEDVEEDNVLCYQYEDGMFLLDGMISNVKGKGGKPLSFRQEPENLNDNKAIAIYLEGIKIGYVYRGNIQDMLNDWISRGHYFFGYINKYSVPENKATYKIGFYKPIENFESGCFTLSKTRKKIDEFTTREDNLLACNEGEALVVEYEEESEVYIVLDSSYQEIGELPKSANQFIKETPHKKIICILDSCDTSDDGKTVARVTIILV